MTVGVQSSRGLTKLVLYSILSLYSSDAKGYNVSLKR